MKIKIITICLIIFTSQVLINNYAQSADKLVVIDKNSNSITLQYGIPMKDINPAAKALAWCKSSGHQGISDGFSFWVKKMEIYQITYECTSLISNPYYTDEELGVKKKKKISQNKETPKTFDTEKASKTCLDLGFKKGTKKYKNCIVELL